MCTYIKLYNIEQLWADTTEHPDETKRREKYRCSSKGRRTNLRSWCCFPAPGKSKQSTKLCRKNCFWGSGTSLAPFHRKIILLKLFTPKCLWQTKLTQVLVLFRVQKVKKKSILRILMLFFEVCIKYKRTSVRRGVRVVYHGGSFCWLVLLLVTASDCFSPHSLKLTVVLLLRKWV